MLSSDHSSGQAEPGGSGESPPLIPGHELLRQIAHGSYGEIWLARTELGVFRAVKIIRRARFADARPYDREFAGLQRYEPVSREHEGLVDVLQVGQNEAAGFFYYVMELADDGNRKSEDRSQRTAPDGSRLPPSAFRLPTSDLRPPSSVLRPPTSDLYVPQTLSHVIRQRHHLPVGEVIELGIRLARALEFLHSRRLVHRDVKPSNIIFVGGQPKLADVGLVADLGNPQSLVGTEGYIPPEGPGSAQADIYSLGKVLYEAATGKDRQEFPDLPTRLGEGHGDPALSELNEVLLKACESQPRARYRTAAEMAADLERLKAGQSLRARRVRHRRRRQVALALAPLAIVVGVGIFASRWSAQHGLNSVRQFTKQQVTDWGSTVVADWDTRPGKELLVIQGNSLLAFGSDGRFLVRWSCPDTATKDVVLALVADADGDGREEAFVSWTSGTNCMVSEIKESGWEVPLRFQAHGREPDAKNLGVTSRLLPAAILPPSASRDGRRKLIATLQTYKGGSPRALCCYDYVTRTQCWQRVMAPSLTSVQPVDFDGDGQCELLVGSQAVENGNSLPDGTDDAHSYVFAFSLSGELLWRRELGGTNTTATVLAWNGKERSAPRIYAWLSGRERPAWQTPPHGSIVQLGTNGTILQPFHHENPLSACVLANPRSGTAPELLVGLTRFDGHLGGAVRMDVLV